MQVGVIRQVKFYTQVLTELEVLIAHLSWARVQVGFESLYNKQNNRYNFNVYPSRKKILDSCPYTLHKNDFLSSTRKETTLFYLLQLKICLLSNLFQFLKFTPSVPFYKATLWQIIILYYIVHTNKLMV